ncbi:MAG: spore germination protein [Tepidanaerobacteraceae bacterium]|nr:spore germination protein [Tepidanaerobacteraceae bacterium]
MIPLLKKLWPFSFIKKFNKNEILNDGLQGKIPEVQTSVSKSLQKNLNYVNTVMKNCQDAIVRPFKIGKKPGIPAFVVFLDGLVDRELLEKSVMIPLMVKSQEENINHFLKNNAFDYIENHLLASTDLKKISEMERVIQSVCSGSTAIFIDGLNKALIVDYEGYNFRNVEEPEVEPVIRGPREGFTEALRVNNALIRRKIKSPKLKAEFLEIGSITKTQVGLFYIDGVVNNKILEEARKRISRINIDGILDTNYIDELIRDAPLCPFPLIHRTEKPDVVAAELLSGKLAILVDGSPSALIVPAVFTEFFISSEDYYLIFIFSSFTRWIRFLSLLIAVFLPALYVAVTTYHQEMIPTPLAISIAATREGVPFPTFVEAALMGLVFEILREAGTRMPRTIGQAVSIVGTLIIGDAAVSAGLTSPPTIIITALTGLAIFTIPAPEMVITLVIIRFLLLILGAVMGLMGIMLATLILLSYLASLRSFGVPYLSPLGPLKPRDLQDSIVRVPWWMMRWRPHLIGSKSKRQPFGQKPGPHKR